MIDMVRDKPANRRPASRRVPAGTHHRPPRRAPRDVAMVVYDGFTAFELGVACEIFGDDRWVAPGDPWYRFFVCGENSAPVVSDGGFEIVVPFGLEKLASV